ncbi:ABC transporter ATP-binding protein [Cytobacillus praedii]|uniref:ABC transporter ATP-binding protein n=1 Tax=Cytobacillus praedii TaxID=1742358 RepID=A0A4R1AXF0_9BACI|nr:ABC transporter ATP-binding protein [Cytobacillus praedii]MED3552669.1 ABC transporter ATP-binding protein [Cytobacillus praedii]TCJ01858.1 ABC transporter ATP-binding protein [Cytobacillus praedii]
MTELKVVSVSKVYKKKTALYPCSLQATKGKCVVLCGGNGAGKSTLLKIIAGILFPSSGTISINGLEMNSSRETYLAQIGFMPDDFNAQEMMTVEEFLHFYGSLRRVGKDRISEVMDLIGLVDKKRELVKSLSKGMRQRLLFGQSILANPTVLLLDEPTNGLDPYWVNQFVEILNQLKKSGTIIVFSTHMMDVAAEVSDVILFMKQGNIIQTITNKNNIEETTMKLMKLHRQ